MSSKPPRITANALIRYCFARAPERNRIIQEFRDEAFPPFKGWYGETEGAIRRYIAASEDDDSSLAGLEKLLEARPIASDFDEQRILRQLEALQAIRDTDLSRVRSSGEVELVEDRIGPFELEGVRVSVRPTNILKRHKVGFKEPFVGVVKPYLSATEPLSEEAVKLYGALLHWYAERQLAHLGDPDPALCFIVDVFGRHAHSAPKAFKQRREMLAYSCIEIADRWNSQPATAGAVRKA